MANLKGKKVGFEQDELVLPRKALDEAGAQTKVVSPKPDKVEGWTHADGGDSEKVDLQLDQANPSEFDALLLPGGVMNPDKLRMEPQVVEFVKAFFEADKPVVAIYHGPWTIIEADMVNGRKIASWPSLKTDLENAGAEWIEREAVVDGKLVSAHKLYDIPAFNRAMLEVFGNAQTKGQSA